MAISYKTRFRKTFCVLKAGITCVGETSEETKTFENLRPSEIVENHSRTRIFEVDTRVKQNL